MLKHDFGKNEDLILQNSHQLMTQNITYQRGHNFKEVILVPESEIAYELHNKKTFMGALDLFNNFIVGSKQH